MKCWLFAVAAGALVAVVNCGDDQIAAVSPCATGSGDLLDCEDVSIDSDEAACDKLLRCGAIPVANPEDRPNCCFDYPRCLDHFGDIPDYLVDATYACVEAASCDQLVWAGSPSEPTRDRRRMPPCLQHGDNP